MPSIYDLKPAFQNLLRPITCFLARRGVTANQITVLACLISLVTGAVLVAMPAQKKILLLVPVVLFIRMALNAIDGMLAREHRMKSALGGFLNELGDVISDAGLYLPFIVWVDGISKGLIFLVVLLGIFSEFAGVVSVQVGGSRRYDGPLGKSDRAFLFGMIAILLGVGIKAGLWLMILLIIASSLGILTIMNRVNRSLKEIAPR